MIFKQCVEATLTSVSIKCWCSFLRIIVSSWGLDTLQDQEMLYHNESLTWCIVMMQLPISGNVWSHLIEALLKIFQRFHVERHFYNSSGKNSSWTTPCSVKKDHENCFNTRSLIGNIFWQEGVVKCHSTFWWMLKIIHFVTSFSLLYEKNPQLLLEELLRMRACSD